MNEEKVCAWCGNVFQLKNNFQKYCSDDCRKSAEMKRITAYRKSHREHYAQYRAKKRDENRLKKEIRQARISIDEYAKAARAAGMSYGKYVGMMRLVREEGGSK